MEVTARVAASTAVNRAVDGGYLAR